jgi:hypothetical protein
MVHCQIPRLLLVVSSAAVSFLLAAVALAEGPHWDTFQPVGCRAPHRMTFSSHLLDIEGDWAVACWSTPGLENRHPDRCVNAELWGEYGEWDIEDYDACPGPSDDVIPNPQS